MARVRWAVIGAGGIARRRTIPEGILAAPSAELVAVYAPRSGKAVAEEFDAIAADSLEALYDIDWDAAYIASPVDCHLRQVVQAAAAGRHVLCEKPLGLDVAEAEQMVSACAQAGVVLGTAFMMRCHACHQYAKQCVAEGRLGQVVSAAAQLTCWYPPLADAWRQHPGRSGGGVLPDLASHCLDLLEFLLDARIVEVSCTTANIVHDYPIEDTATILATFDNKAVATVNCSFGIPDGTTRNGIEICGSRGTLTTEGTIGQDSGGVCIVRSASEGSQVRRHDRRCGEDLGIVNIYQAQIEAFNDSVLGNSEPRADGRQGLRIQKILARCYESAMERKTVPVEV